MKTQTSQPNILNMQFKTIILNANKKPQPTFANLATENLVGQFDKLKVQDEKTLPVHNTTCWCIYKHSNTFAQNFTHSKCVSFEKLPFKSVNQLANLFLNCYSKHLGIYLRPEDFHLHFVLLVSNLISEKPEAFQSIFTDSTKQKLVVPLQSLEAEALIRNVTVWDLAMREWADMLMKNVKAPEFIDAIRTSYSTNTFVDTVLNDICAMDTMKSYFEFEGICECGFPAVTLEGTEQDWVTLISVVRTIATTLNDKHLLHYVNTKFIPILEMMLRTFRNTHDDQVAIQDYWARCICARYPNGSGYLPLQFSGWIIDLFPTMFDGKIWCYESNQLDRLRTSMVSTPIHIDDNGHEFDIDARAGSFGLYQYDDTYHSLGIVNGYYLIRYSNE